MWIFKASASHPLHLQVTSYKLQEKWLMRWRSLAWRSGSALVSINEVSTGMGDRVGVQLPMPAIYLCI